MKTRPLLRLAALLLAAAACAADAGDPTAPVVPAPPPASPSPAPPAPSGTAVSQFTTLDLTRLDDYTPSLPGYYLTADVTRLDNSRTNPITDAGATLGRVLFFDRQLSVNDAVACASCHEAAIGFTDADRFSVGFDGTSRTTAHSMRLGNARWYAGSGFFWDKRTTTLEAQALEPIQHPVEMGFDASHGGLGAITTKLAAVPYYPELFAFVYGDSTITPERIQRAIAQYVRSMASTTSRWDDGYALTWDPALPDRGLSRPVPTLSAEENRGLQLFLAPPNQGGAGCAGCHEPPTFSLAANSGSNGLDAGETTVFKSPSLKNVAASGPYMHDGRFATLEEVVTFYDTGVQDGPALDQRLRRPGGQPVRLNLTAADRAALVAFLRTLTDVPRAGDARYTSPFR
jgi:cytochrome c peroxidase